MELLLICLMLSVLLAAEIAVSSVQMRTTGTLEGNTEKMCAYICDLATGGSQVISFPELARLPAIRGSKIVFYISHESGMGHQSKVAPYRAQIQARAAENNVWVVQANAPANPDHSGSAGHSRIIQPDGTILAEASVYDEEVVTAAIDPDKATRKFAQRSLTSDFLRSFWEEGLRLIQEK